MDAFDEESEEDNEDDERLMNMSLILDERL